MARIPSFSLERWGGDVSERENDTEKRKQEKRVRKGGRKRGREESERVEGENPVISMYN